MCKTIGNFVATEKRTRLYNLKNNNKTHCKLDLADTDLAKNLSLKDTLQKIWATIFDFEYISPLKIAENLGLTDKSLVTDFPLNRYFTVL